MVLSSKENQNLACCNNLNIEYCIPFVLVCDSVCDTLLAYPYKVPIARERHYRGFRLRL